MFIRFIVGNQKSDTIFNFEGGSGRKLNLVGTFKKIKNYHLRFKNLIRNTLDFI